MALPLGGPLKIDVGVAELLLAQLAIICAPRNDKHEKEACARRKAVLESLDAAQRGHARTVCSTSAAPAIVLPRRKVEHQSRRALAAFSRAAGRASMLA